MRWPLSVRTFRSGCSCSLLLSFKSLFLVQICFDNFFLISCRFCAAIEPDSRCESALVGDVLLRVCGWPGREMVVVVWICYEFGIIGYLQQPRRASKQVSEWERERASELAGRQIACCACAWPGRVCARSPPAARNSTRPRARARAQSRQSLANEQQVGGRPRQLQAAARLTLVACCCQRRQQVICFRQSSTSTFARERQSPKGPSSAAAAAVARQRICERGRKLCLLCSFSSSTGATVASWLAARRASQRTNPSRARAPSVILNVRSAGASRAFG